MQNAAFLKAFPLTKVDYVNHTVTGLATAELPDLDNEIAVYDDTKKSYEVWSAAAAASTKAAGQSVSLGNIRVQHNAGQVGGKVTAINYDDSAKKIFIETKPISEEMFNQIAEGHFRGFSHAGTYKYRECNECSTPMDQGYYCPSCKKRVMTKYAPTLAEISYVDSPCLAEATYTAVKADGSTEIRKFKESIIVKTEVAKTEEKPVRKQLEILYEDEHLIVRQHADGRISTFLKAETKTKTVDGENLPASAFLFTSDKEDPDTWKVAVQFSTEEKTKKHITLALQAFAKVQNESDEDKAHAWRKLKALAEEHGVDLTTTKSVANPNLVKGIYQIQMLAELLGNIRYLQQLCSEEGLWEEDVHDQEIADNLGKWLATGAEILIQIVEEETSEMTAGKAARKGVPTMAELAKAGKSLAAHLGKAFKKSADHHEKLAAAENNMAQEHTEKAEFHSKCMGKSEGGDDGHKDAVAFHKSMAKEHEKIAKAHEAHADHCNTMADTMKSADEEPEEKKAAAVPAPEVAKATAAAAGTAAAQAAHSPAVTSIIQELNTSLQTVAADGAVVTEQQENDVTGEMREAMGAMFVETFRTTLEDVKDSPDIKEMIAVVVKQQMASVLAGKIQPDGVKLTGTIAVPRPGESEHVAKSQNYPQGDGLGLSW